MGLLEPRAYTDPAMFDLERRLVLRAGWLPLCRADQLPNPGDRWAGSLVGEPVIAVRTDEGAVRVLSNVCPHRGSTVADDGTGHSSTLVCPYHRWSFRLDGSLIGAPLAEGADLDGACLSVVRSMLWEGFVLVNLAGDADDPELAGLSHELAPWSWSDLVTVASQSYDSSWNWKVMVENWIECYHHLGTHRATIEPIQPARTTRIVDSGAEPWVAMTVETVAGLEGPSHCWIPGLGGDRARDLSVWSAFPLLLGGSVSRYAFWLQVEPLTVDHHRVTWHLLVHPAHLELFPPDEVAAILAMFDMVHQEDMEACARVQRGLASGHLRRFRLVELEATIAHFQSWLSAQCVPRSSDPGVLR